MEKRWMNSVIDGGRKKFCGLDGQRNRRKKSMR